MRLRDEMMMAGVAMLALMVGGCGLVGGGFADGDVGVCYDMPDNAALDESQGPGRQSYRADGEVVFDKKAGDVSDMTGLDCDPMRVLKVKDGETTYRIGYRAETKSEDVTPDVGLVEGEKVELAMSIYQPWWTCRAFSITRKDGGLALAVNDGYGAEISADHMDGLEVKVGESYGPTASVSCGRGRAQELKFNGQTKEVLGVEERAQVEVSTGTVHAMNVVSYEYEKLNCTDTSAPNAWVVWR